MRAAKIVSICEIVAIDSAKPLCGRYPILNNWHSSDQDWNFLFTIAAVGACIGKDEKILGEKEESGGAKSASS